MPVSCRTRRDTRGHRPPPAGVSAGSAGPHAEGERRSVARPGSGPGSGMELASNSLDLCLVEEGVL